MPAASADMAPAVAGLACSGDSLYQSRPSPGSTLGSRGHQLEGGFWCVRCPVVRGRSGRTGVVEEPEGLSHGVGWSLLASAAPTALLPVWSGWRALSSQAAISAGSNLTK